MRILIQSLPLYLGSALEVKGSITAIVRAIMTLPCIMMEQEDIMKYHSTVIFKLTFPFFEM